MISAGVTNLARACAPMVNLLVARRSASRGLSAPTNRPAFLARLASSDVLEIGPFDVPALCGERVRYFDILDTEGLRMRAQVQPGHDPERVPDIDYCSPTGDLSVIDRTFDAVFSSHVIEHQPDLIKHLNDVFALLAPGGRYYLIAPDKRYCFDHFLTLSSTAEVVAAHRSSRTMPTGAAILAHRLETTHNRALLHWLGMHGGPTVDDARQRSAAEEAAAADRGKYIDVHTWIFTPERFRSVICDLVREDHIGLKLVEVTETSFAFLEYFAILERPAAVSG